MSLRSMLLVLFLLQISSILVVGKKEEPAEVVKQDLPYIKCEVCERAVAELITAVDTIKEENKQQFKKSNKPIEEVKILEIIENLCKPTNETGSWIRTLDIQEQVTDKKKYLHLVEPGGYSKCKTECLTIAKSCENLFEKELDIDDVSAMLWKKSLTVDEAQEKICYKMTKRCGKFPESVSGNYKRKDFRFEAMEEKEYEMEKMLASMKAMGLGGSMYNRDDMESMMGGGMGGMGGMGGEYDDYGDEDMEGNEREDEQAERPSSMEL
jgi:hypothetical protein